MLHLGTPSLWQIHPHNVSVLNFFHGAMPLVLCIPNLTVVRVAAQSSRLLCLAAHL